MEKQYNGIERRENSFCNRYCPFNGDSPVEGAKWIQSIDDEVKSLIHLRSEIEKMKKVTDGIQKQIWLWQGAIAVLVAIPVWVILIMKILGD